MDPKRSHIAINNLLERCHSRVIKDDRLWCKKWPEGREIGPGFAVHPMTVKFSVNPAVKRVPFVNQGRILLYSILFYSIILVHSIL